MIRFNVQRTVLTLLATAIAIGLLLTGCGPACGRLCEPDFWHEDEVPKNPSVAAVQAELDKGADVNAEVEEQRYSEFLDEHYTVLVTPLKLAVEYGSEDVVELLLDQGSNPNGGDSEEGTSPLDEALLRGSPEVVELLLDHGADPNGGAQEGQPSPLSSLSMGFGTGNEERDTQIAELLLDRGADVNWRIKSGDTPLIAAARAGKYVSFVQTMILYGADVNAENDSGSTALDLTLLGPIDEADTRGKIARLLLQHGADPNAKPSGVFGSALHVAVMARNVVAVQVLLDHGADVDAITDSGSTACDYGRGAARGDDSQEKKSAWEEIEPLVCQ